LRLELQPNNSFRRFPLAKQFDPAENLAQQLSKFVLRELPYVEWISDVTMFVPLRDLAVRRTDHEGSLASQNLLSPSQKPCWVGQVLKVFQVDHDIE